MHYIDGFVAAVPDAQREAYIRYAGEVARLLKEHGALQRGRSAGATTCPKASSRRSRWR